MANNVINWAKKIPLKASLSQVLISMACITNQDGRCDGLKLRKLSELSGLSILKVFLALNKLAKLKIIVINFRKKFYYLRVQISPDKLINNYEEKLRHG